MEQLSGGLGANKSEGGLPKRAAAKNRDSDAV